MSEHQVYNLAKLSEDRDHVFELSTASNAIVPISMKALAALNPAYEGKRAPSQMELLKLADTALGQIANPYANECGLLPVFSGGFHYEVWVAAQVRMRKAQAQQDYRGFRWGWITAEMKRHESGRASTANPDEVVGAWGEVFREGNEPYYHEIFMKEYKKSADKGSWGKTPLTMLAKVIRDQTHKFAYADKMGNLSTLEELQTYNQAPTDPPTCNTPKRQDRRTVESQEVTSQEEPTTPPADTDGITEEDAGGTSEEDFLDTTYEPVVDDDEPGSEAALALIPSVKDAFFEMLGKKPEDCEKPNVMFVATCAMALSCPEEDCNRPDKFSVNMLNKVQGWIDSQKDGE